MGAHKNIKQLAEEWYDNNSDSLVIEHTYSDIITTFEAGYKAASEGMYSLDQVIQMISDERDRCMEICQTHIIKPNDIRALTVAMEINNKIANRTQEGSQPLTDRIRQELLNAGI